MNLDGREEGQMGNIDMQEEGHFITELKPFIVPLRFGIIAQPIDITTSSSLTAHSLYKGGFPRRRNLPFLSRLRLKTVLSLTPKSLDKLDEEVTDWAKQNIVTLVHVKCEKPKDDGGGLSKEAAAKALLYLLDSRQLPLYVHCLDGQSVSTLLVGVLRRVQAWSTRAIVEEIKQSIGNDEEVIAYQTNFIEKFGKPDGIRLPPRRFIPEWTWSDPSPLKRLKDPYDVIVAKEKMSDRGPLPSNSGGNEHQHKRQDSTDGFFAMGVNASQSSPIAPTYGTGSLPVQHPLLRIKFDPDPDLPPPLALLTPLHHSRESSNHFSPTSSRPSSRAGRNSSHGHPLHPHHQHPHHHHHSEVRALSRPGSTQASPRRKMLHLDQSPNLLTTNNNNSSVNDATFSPPIHHQSEFIGFRLAYGTSSSSEIDGSLQQSKLKSPIAKRESLAGQESNGSSTPTRLSLSLNEATTPRASTSASLLRAVRPSTSRGAIYGLGLQNHDKESEEDLAEPTSPTSHLSLATLQSEDIKRPFALDRSTSEVITSTRSKVEENSILDDVQDEEEYYSDTHEDARKQEDDRLQKQRRNGGHEDAHEADSKEEGHDEGQQEEEDEEEEDEEEEEEEESDGDEDDGLALEALDLEGY